MYYAGQKIENILDDIVLNKTDNADVYFSVLNLEVLQACASRRLFYCLPAELLIVLSSVLQYSRYLYSIAY